VSRERQRGVHRRKRERRPLPGMLLHIDGSRHHWFQDDRCYDLLVILDDATSRIYYAQLVEGGIDDDGKAVRHSCRTTLRSEVLI